MAQGDLTLETRAIVYDCDGARLTGYFADDAPHVKKPAILVAHEAFGMNDHIRARTRRLAELGYAAFALDMYGVEGLSLSEAVSRHIELVSAPGLMLARASAALRVLTTLPGVDQERLAAIGFCQGGMTARTCAQRGAGSMRRRLSSRSDASRRKPDEPIQAKVLMMIGDQDPDVPAQDRADFAAEMERKQVDWQLHLFGRVGHAHTNPDIDRLNKPGYGYDRAADKRSWTMMLALFEEVFAGGGRQ